MIGIILSVFVPMTQRITVFFVSGAKDNDIRIVYNIDNLYSIQIYYKAPSNI